MEFVSPVTAALAQLRYVSASFQDYLLVVPLALLLGALIMWLDWRLTGILWIRSSSRSVRFQNATAFVIFASHACWIALAMIAGSEVAGFLIARFVGRAG
jgi:hypothetical protein